MKSTYRLPSTGGTCVCGGDLGLVGEEALEDGDERGDLFVGFGGVSGYWTGGCSRYLGVLGVLDVWMFEIKINVVFNWCLREVLHQQWEAAPWLMDGLSSFISCISSSHNQ